MKPTLLAMLMAVFLLMGCGSEKQAAELMNSVAHSFNLASAASQDLPHTLNSGECSTRISSGAVALSYRGYNSFALTTLAVSLTLESDSSSDSGTGTTTQSDTTNNDFICTMQVQYQLDPSGTSLSGPGMITSCDDFSCTLAGKNITCEAMKKALQKYTCDTVATF